MIVRFGSCFVVLILSDITYSRAKNVGLIQNLRDFWTCLSLKIMKTTVDQGFEYNEDNCRSRV